MKKCPSEITIYWERKASSKIKRRIRERFGIDGAETVNGETQANIRPEDMPDLEECRRRGFLQIRIKKPSNKP